MNESAIERQKAMGNDGFESGFHLLASLALSPILIAQGLVTRRRVPKLPEPPGNREGVIGDGSPLRLLILGDSAAAGVGAPHQDQALLGQIVLRLADKFRVTWRLQARNGNTTATILELLKAQPAQSYDVAVTSLGVNDVTSLVGRNHWRRQQAELRTILKQKFGIGLVIVSGLPPLHGFPALPQPLRWCLGTRATQFDRYLEADVVADGIATFLDLRFTSDTSLMASDGFHPGPGIYSEWAGRVVALIAKE